MRVADTGIGVAAAEMPRLFERFHRIENARSRSNEGSGIGLALVQELVELHGGTITAASVEGAGTTFTIRLPVRPRPPARRAWPRPAGRTVSATADPFVQEALRWLPGDSAGRAPPAATRRPARAPDLAGRPAGRRPPGCWSPTTTPTCASTWPGCCGPATRSPRSPTGRPRWTRSARSPPTW